MLYKCFQLRPQIVSISKLEKQDFPKGEFYNENEILLPKPYVLMSVLKFSHTPQRFLEHFIP